MQPNHAPRLIYRKKILSRPSPHYHDVKTSIGLEQDTKSTLARLKPPGLSWDEFFLVLNESINHEEYRKNLKKTLDRLEGESVDAAIERVYSMRHNPEANLSFPEAESRLKRRRLARRLYHLSEQLETHEISPELKAQLRTVEKELNALAQG